MGDLAIDDVSITNGSCQVHTAPPTSPTEPSFYSDPSTLNPSTDTPSVSSTNEPSLATGLSTLHPSTGKHSFSN